MSDTKPNPHRTALERLLAEQPPRRLRCFDTDLAWREFLLLSRDSGERVTRRQDVGKSIGDRQVTQVFADGLHRLPCAECPAAYRRKMEAVGRCELVPPTKAARRWLKTLLAGGPMAILEIKALATSAGFAWRTVQRARQRDHLFAQRVGFSLPTLWCISRAAFDASRAKFGQAADAAAHKTDQARRL